MTLKNRLLYPLIIGAAISVITFSCLGVAAITGYLPFGRGAIDPFFAFTSGIPDQKSVAVAVAPAASGPTHLGLTRQSGSEPVPASRPFGFRPGQRIGRTACSTCGVVYSIQAGAARPALVTTASDGQTHAAALVISAIHAEGEVTPADDARMTSFVVRVRMEDGTIRTIYEIQRPRFSVGERVRLINGSIVSQG